jgi:hypothetical protein
VTSGRPDRSPPSPSALCDHPHHPNAIPATASQSPTLWKRAVTGCRHASYCTPIRPHVNGTLESSHGRSPNRRPLHRHPRSRSWTRTGRAMTPARSMIRQDGRLLHDVVHHASTRRRNSAARLYTAASLAYKRRGSPLAAWEDGQHSLARLLP